MELKEILAVVGHNGLFKYVSQGRNGIIVESLTEEGVRTHLSASAKVSSLEDIAMFTESKEVPFKNVLKSIFDMEKGQPTISHKAEPQQLKDWFAKVLPDYDRARVYVSDMKKAALWYNLLQSKNLLSFEEEKPSESSEEAKSE